MRYGWPESLTYEAIVNSPSIFLKLQLFGVSISTIIYMLNKPEPLQGLSRIDVIKYNLVYILKLWLLGRELTVEPE